MKKMISTGIRTISVPPQNAVRVNQPVRTRMSLPGRGYFKEPVPIGLLLTPLQQMISHPDRNRLMAEFFKDYK